MYAYIFLAIIIILFALPFIFNDALLALLSSSEDKKKKLITLIKELETKQIYKFVADPNRKYERPMVQPKYDDPVDIWAGIYLPNPAFYEAIGKYKKVLKEMENSRRMMLGWGFLPGYAELFYNTKQSFRDFCDKSDKRGLLKFSKNEMELSELYLKWLESDSNKGLKEDSYDVESMNGIGTIRIDSLSRDNVYYNFVSFLWLPLIPLCCYYGYNKNEGEWITYKKKKQNFIVLRDESMNYLEILAIYAIRWGIFGFVLIVLTFS